MARHSTAALVALPLPVPGTRYEIEWGERRAPVRPGFTPGSVYAVTPDGGRRCVLLTMTRDEWKAAYAEDIARLGGHSPAEQGRLLDVLRYSPAHSGNEIPLATPVPSAPPSLPQQPSLFS